jgi:hypothetical protein
VGLAQGERVKRDKLHGQGDMMMEKSRVCKDCGGEKVITPLDRKGKPLLETIAVELCALCLQSRAQLQTVKEDKLPFPKLLAKIRSETAKRVRSEIMSASATPLERLRMGYYKGSTVYTTLSEYWVNQLKQE